MSLYPSAIGLFVPHTRDRKTSPAARQDETRQAEPEGGLDAAWTISVDDYFDELVARSNPRPWHSAGAGIMRLGRAAVETALVTGIGVALAAGALLLR